MSSQKPINLSINLELLGKVIANDPLSFAELAKGLKAGKEKPDPITTQLGYCNMGTEENPEWYSIFANAHANKTSRERNFLWRSRSGKETVFRLKRQENKANEGQLPAHTINLLNEAINNNREAAAQIAKIIIASQEDSQGSLAEAPDLPPIF